MPDSVTTVTADQASGLRRLFRAPAGRAVAFVSGREACGRTRLLVQTAAALARAGESVLIVDENAGSGSAHEILGVQPGRDLAEALAGRADPALLIQEAAPRVALLAAARLAARGIDGAARPRLDAVLGYLQQSHTCLLIDGAERSRDAPSPLLHAAPWVVAVVGAESSAITRAYAAIKRLARETGRERFQVVITRARSEAETRAVFGNLQRTAGEHLGVSLEFLAGVPQPATDHIADALLDRLAGPARARAPRGEGVPA